MNATHKVLVVDDDPVVGSSIDRVLSPRGYAVITAANGEEALERLAHEVYDVVYTDIRMPGMDGLEVARRIKATSPWLPVVIVTGYGTEQNELQAIEMGTAGFLRKPLSPEVIEGSLDRAVASAQAPAAAPEAAPQAAPEAAPEAAAAVATAEPAAGGFWHFARNVGLFIAAPFIGLAYLLVFPFVGLGMLAWIGVRSLAGRGKAE
jgi:CheY-like chemotaxis protein